MRHCLTVSVGSDTVRDTLISHPGTADDLAAGTLAVFLAEHRDTDPAQVSVTVTPHDLVEGEPAGKPVTATTASHAYAADRWVERLTAYVCEQRGDAFDPAPLVVNDLTGTKARRTRGRDLPELAYELQLAARTIWTHSDLTNGEFGGEEGLTEVEAERVLKAADQITNAMYRAAKVRPSGRASQIDREKFPELAWSIEAHELAAALDDLFTSRWTVKKAQRVADAAGAVGQIITRKLRDAYTDRNLIQYVDTVRMAGMGLTYPDAGTLTGAEQVAVLNIFANHLHDLAGLLQDAGFHGDVSPVGPRGPWYVRKGGDIVTGVREGLRSLYFWTGRETSDTGSTLDRSKLATTAVGLLNALEWELERLEGCTPAAAAEAEAKA